LKYTEAVLLEALRLYAPAYLVGRCANRDVQLGSYTLGSGTTVLISPYVMHRSREYWLDADHFNPDRWVEVQQRPGYAGFMSLMSNVGEAVNGAYVPFGAGPRNCIGTGLWTSRANLSIRYNAWYYSAS
jgi:cytochrome P450